MAFMNDPFAPPYVQSPRLRVLTGGVEIAGAISASVTSNNWYQGDRFSASFALAADPTHDLGWWSTTQPIPLDIQIAFVAPNTPVSWQSLAVGEVDKTSINLDAGIVQVNGRDLTARFIEAKTQESFLNQTFSEVVTTLAARHSMTADVTPTTTLVGRFYEIDHDHVTMNQFHRTTTEWDLLVNLAQHEGFDLWVSGTTLHAHPSTVLSPAAPGVFNPTPPAGALVYSVLWIPPSPSNTAWSNVLSPRVDRAMTLAKDVIVQVKSWHSKMGRAFVKTARAVGVKSSGPASKPQTYVFVMPNLTEDDAQKYANAKLADITKHERLLSFSAPGDLTLTPRCMVALQGTASDWDQYYYIDTIERSISVSGFTMSVNCKNHSTGSQTVLQ